MGYLFCSFQAMLVPTNKLVKLLCLLASIANETCFFKVRSMASVALRKAYEEDIGLKFHFNYFALDFNEEFSALYGGTLDDQAEYAAEAINAILTMYNEVR